MVASASRLILSTSLRWSVNFSSWYSGLRVPFGLPAFFISLCSQETCCVFLLPLSSDENIGIRQNLIPEKTPVSSRAPAAQTSLKGQENRSIARQPVRLPCPALH